MSPQGEGLKITVLANRWREFCANREPEHTAPSCKKADKKSDEWCWPGFEEGCSLCRMHQAVASVEAP